MGISLRRNPFSPIYPIPLGTVLMARSTTPSNHHHCHHCNGCAGPRLAHLASIISRWRGVSLASSAASSRPSAAR